jgi:hypothetical protein
VEIFACAGGYDPAFANRTISANDEPLGISSELLVDLHCHTSEGSDDSDLSLERLALTAAARGLDAVCVTDHDAFASEQALKAVGNRAGILLLPGTEINTDAGHVLVFGLTEYRFGFHHPDRLASAVAEANAAMVLAHPYRRALPPGSGFSKSESSAAFSRGMARAVNNPLLGCVDAVEALNGRALAREAEFARAFAASVGIPSVGGSDAHREEGVALCATRFADPVADVAGLIQALKMGNFEPVRLRN